MRALVDITVIVPADPLQTRQAVRWAAAADGPVFMRVNRFKVRATTPDDAPFERGRALTLRPGNDVAILAYGTMVSRALDAAEALAARGVQARVLNVATVSPLDADAVLRAAAETGRIVTVEEALARGGLGSAVAELVACHRPVPMRILGLPGFAPTGSAAFLLDHFGLNAEGIARAALELTG